MVVTEQWELDNLFKEVDDHLKRRNISVWFTHVVIQLAKAEMLEEQGGQWHFLANIEEEEEEWAKAYNELLNLGVIFVLELTSATLEEGIMKVEGKTNKWIPSMAEFFEGVKVISLHRRAHPRGAHWEIGENLKKQEELDSPHHPHQ